MVAFEPMQKSERLLSQRIATALRQAIIAGEYQPGDRLIEEEISHQMQVSRGSIRDALRKLEQEGLIISFPHRKTEVLGVSELEAKEVLIPIRIILERFAFRHALPLMTDEDFTDLEPIVEEMQAACEKGDLAGAVETDIQFHKTVIERSQQVHALQIWQSISPRISAYFYQYGPKHASLLEIAEQHRELLEVMRTRELEAILTILEKHIQDTALEPGAENERFARTQQGDEKGEAESSSR